VRPKSRLTLGEKLAAGDVIVLLESSGIHANGVSLARKLAERIPGGFGAEMEGGKLFGEALLAPTVLYPPVTEALRPPASCRTTAPTSPATAGAS